jgi:hypothetical protein
VDSLAVVQNQTAAARITSVIHGNHRHLGLRRCDPNVGIVWSGSGHQGIDMDRCMIASIRGSRLHVVWLRVQLVWDVSVVGIFIYYIYIYIYYLSPKSINPSPKPKIQPISPPGA